MNSFWRVRTFIQNLTEFSFIWLSCFSWPAPCPSLFASVSLLSLFVFISVLSTSLHLQNKLFPWTTEGSSEVDDIVSTSSTSAWAGFTHYGSVEGFFSKKTCFFWVWIEALTVIITKTSPLGVCFPIYLCIFVVETTSWFIRSSPWPESRFRHIFIICDINETMIILSFNRIILSDVFFGKAVLKIFGKFLEKQPRQSSYSA